MQPGCVGMRYSVKVSQERHGEPCATQTHGEACTWVHRLSWMSSPRHKYKEEPWPRLTSTWSVEEKCFCGGRKNKTETPPWPPSEVAGGEQCWSRV